ncbi:MAG TPA: ABC transporter ATP-binding protein, partial [Tepidisphaeraceae bacterium]|nr:ABC transporter ATP-binding protein [Tepidisphaeraceae bacterium]
MALVEFQNVEKTYRMGGTSVRALDGVSFGIDPGEFVSIIGPSGSGKSTLMHLLGFLDQPTGGTISFDGQDVSKISPRQRATIRANRIGFVFQAFNLLPRLSVLQNA